jgi:hypothetical protein
MLFKDIHAQTLRQLIARVSSNTLHEIGKTNEHRLSFKNLIPKVMNGLARYD